MKNLSHTIIKSSSTS